MLNEDELRDALLLVFANKQDLPVSATPIYSKPAIFYGGSNGSNSQLTMRLLECHERCRDHG